MLDWLACVAGARGSDVAAAIHGRTALRGGGATRWLGNVLEMDDVHRTGRLHPGPVIWPIALEESVDEECDFDIMLAGAVQGYEAMISVGSTFDDHHYSFYQPLQRRGSPD